MDVVWVENLCGYFDRATKEELVKGVGWYGSAREWARGVATRLKVQYERFAAFLSVLSPRFRWTLQQKYAEIQWRHFANGGSVEDCPGPGTYKNKAKAKRIVDNPLLALYEALGGAKTTPKVRAFYANLTGDESHATVDTWMVRAAYGLNLHEDLCKITRSLYRLLAETIRYCAALKKVSVAAFQAVIWLVVKRLWDTPKLRGQAVLEHEGRRIVLLPLRATSYGRKERPTKVVRREAV